MSRTVKVADLIGVDLDYAVAVTEGKTPERIDLTERDVAPGQPPYVYLGCGYSTNWEQAGPIIERCRIDLEAYPFGEWGARCRQKTNVNQYGPTPVIAAMRYYVASKFGEEIELP